MLRLICIISPLLGLLLASDAPATMKIVPPGFLTIVNQHEHTLILFDIAARKILATIDVGVNGHEVAVSPDGKFAYVPIYGNSGVGKPGTDGQFIDIIDLHTRALAGHIDLGKPVRPHCAKFGPDGFLYVSAELANSIFVVDTAARKVIAEIPTGKTQSHMFVISPDGHRAYTSNVESGTVSVLDLQKHSLVTVIPVAKSVQRISISPDGRRAFAHDQDQPRIAVIDTATNTATNYISLPSTIYSSAITRDGNTLLAASPAGYVYKINLATQKIDTTIDVPKSAGELLLAPDGKSAFLSCPQIGSLQVINVEAGRLTEAIPFTIGVDGLDWTPFL